MGRPSKIKTGDVIQMAHGPVRVIEYVNHNNIKVCYEKSYRRVLDFYTTVPNCSLKDDSSCPYDRRINGIGYYGQGPYKIKNKTPPFSIWSNMIKRCYNEKAVLEDQNYIYTVVSDEWLCAQNFAEWHYTKSNYIEGFVLDKDLLSDSRFYSEETCLYVPGEINTAIVLSYKDKKEKHLPVGVVRCKQTGLYSVSAGTRGNSTWGGRHKTVEEAFRSYCNIKNDQLRYLANKYESFMPSNAVYCLNNFVRDRIIPNYE